MKDELHFDPIADGPPPRMGKIEMLFMAAWAMLSAWNFALGDVTVGMLTAVLALDTWFHAKNERSAYLDGYKSAIIATAEQLNGDVEVSNRD